MTEDTTSRLILGQMTDLSIFLSDKSTSSIDANASNKNPSQTSTDPPKVKLRVKPIPPSPQTKKDNKQPVTSIKNTKPVEQKPIKKYYCHHPFSINHSPFQTCAYPKRNSEYS